MRYWNIARQRHYRSSARCCWTLCVSVDRAAHPSPHTRGKPRLLDVGRRILARDRFAPDSPLEGSGFELPVPLRALFCAFADADETNLPGQGFRDRKFADSSLEGDEFELLVPRHESPRFPKHPGVIVAPTVRTAGKNSSRRCRHGGLPANPVLSACWPAVTMPGQDPSWRPSMSDPQIAALRA